MKEELENRRYEVLIPEMPDTDHPKIEAWVSKLAEVIGTPRKGGILIGHSIGCQVILRYLETLGENQKVDKVIVVAGWFRLTSTAAVTEEEKLVAKPWLKTPIDFNKAKTKANKFIGIFSDNDYFVPLEVNLNLLKEKLNAEIVLLNKRGHFSQEDGVNQLPELLNFL